MKNAFLTPCVAPSTFHGPSTSTTLPPLAISPVNSTTPSVVLSTGVPVLPKMSMPLCTPELPQGSNQKDLEFQSFAEAPATGIWMRSGSNSPATSTASRVRTRIFAIFMARLFRARNRCSRCESTRRDCLAGGLPCRLRGRAGCPLDSGLDWPLGQGQQRFAMGVVLCRRHGDGNQCQRGGCHHGGDPRSGCALQPP